MIISNVMEIESADREVVFAWQDLQDRTAKKAARNIVPKTVFAQMEFVHATRDFQASTVL